MQNIEIYGLKDDEGVKIANKIDELLREKDYKDEYVITYVQSYVCDREEVSQPFLRLVTTPSDHIDDIINELRKISINIQVVILAQFIQAEDEGAWRSRTGIISEAISQKRGG